MEFRQESEIQILLKELIVMKARISKLLTQARQGLITIQDAKAEMARQNKEIDEQKEQIAKLDCWLESINYELNKSTKQIDVLTEQDIIRYIEIYERYIREYEEYEIILKSITVINHDESSQSLRHKLKVMQKSLEETRNLVILEIERLRNILIQIRSVGEIVEDDISQTDRTIDSTSMPEEIASPRETEVPEHKIKEDIEVKSEIITPKVTEDFECEIRVKNKLQEIVPEKSSNVQENKPSQKESKIEEVETQVKKPTFTTETQTGQSLMSDAPSVADKSVICQPEVKVTHDVSITCAPPQEVEVQTSDPESHEKELLENIQVKQTTSEGHETIEIASRPIIRQQNLNEQSLLIDANYKDNKLNKDSQLNIIHSLPQSFETVMVEPDETTTEVVVDADGTKRIIVKKVRKTLVTRQQTIQTQQHSSQVLSSDGIPHEQSFSQITLKEDKGSTSTTMKDGDIRHIQYQTYGGQVISSLPGGEVTIQEFTSKPDMVIKMEKNMTPEQILQLAEGEAQPQIQTSSASVTAVVQQVTKRIIKTRRRIIRRVVIIDGKEHVTEEVIEEPDNVEVFEEQIPRVSISVKDQGGVEFEEIDDSYDNSDKPPGFTPYNKGHDETDDHKRGEKDLPTIQEQEGSSHKDNKSFMQTPQTFDSRETTKEFVKKERESYTHPEMITEPDIEIVNTDIADEPHLSLISGFQHSNIGTTSNMATITQKITRKITRTKKRIIRHIQIIDGKEHITEEVIDEPDDVEIIEEEPRVTQTVQEKDCRTRRVKVIRHVQVIDGKEHVTEQIIEEPDDENSLITNIDVDVKISKPDILEVDQEVMQTSPSKAQISEVHITTEPVSKEAILPRGPIISEVTKQLIGSEKDQYVSQIDVELPKKEIDERCNKKADAQIEVESVSIFDNKFTPAKAAMNVIQKSIETTEPDLCISPKITSVLKVEHPSTTLEISSATSATDLDKELSIIDFTKLLLRNEGDHTATSLIPVTTSVFKPDTVTQESKSEKSRKEIEISEVLQDIQAEAIGPSEGNLPIQKEIIPTQIHEVQLEHVELPKEPVEKELLDKFSSKILTEGEELRLNHYSIAGKGDTPITNVTSKDMSTENLMLGEQSLEFKPKEGVINVSKEFIESESVPTEFLDPSKSKDAKILILEKEVTEPETLDHKVNNKSTEIKNENITTSTDVQQTLDVKKDDSLLKNISDQSKSKLDSTTEVSEHTKPKEQSSSDQEIDLSEWDIVEDVSVQLDESVDLPKEKTIDLEVVTNISKESNNINQLLATTDDGDSIKFVELTKTHDSIKEEATISKEKQVVKPEEPYEDVTKTSSYESSQQGAAPSVETPIFISEDVKLEDVGSDAILTVEKTIKADGQTTLVQSMEALTQEIQKSVDDGNKTQAIEDNVFSKLLKPENDTITTADKLVSSVDKLDILNATKNLLKEDSTEVKLVPKTTIENITAAKDPNQIKDSSLPEIELVSPKQDETEKVTLDSTYKVKSKDEILEATEIPKSDVIKTTTEGLATQLLTSDTTPVKEKVGKETDSKLSVVEHPKAFATEHALLQSSVEVETLKVGNIITEEDSTKTSESPKVCYVNQYIKGSSESIDKVEDLTNRNTILDTKVVDTLKPSEIVSKTNIKGDTNLLLESERYDTHMRDLKEIVVTPDIKVPEKPVQTIDISMSITKVDVSEKSKPQVKMGYKVEGLDCNQPSIVKKDIEVHLPSEIQITTEHIEQPKVLEKDEPAEIEFKLEDTSKDHKKNKKRKKHKRSSVETDSTETDIQTETEKSIVDTESSSLSHYVELPTSPPVESPKPTHDVFQTKLPESEHEYESSLIESEAVTEEKGYDPEDISLAPVLTPVKPKRQKKRKQYGVSEETTYPKLSTTESDDTSISSPVEIIETIHQKKMKAKKGKKKPPVEQGLNSDMIVKSPQIGSEIVQSPPKEESYHTISETSDVSTVRVVEECIQSSPETLHRDITTTITFPVPVVEEIVTHEHSAQITPKVVEKAESPIEVESTKPETTETELQTSPTPVSEILVQTTPIEDKEVDTQTIEEITTLIEKAPVADLEVQTSATKSPEKIIHSEATTQVLPRDIFTPEEKFSQTSSPIEEAKIELQMESREIQTSPVPIIYKEEKSTEVVIETTDTNIQTTKQEIVDQETSTTPTKETEISEMSVQTPEVPMISIHTQSGLSPDHDHIIPQLDVQEKQLIDNEQQTSPISEETISPKLVTEKAVTIDSSQQTSPRIDGKLPLEFEEEIRKDITTVDTTQQTTPREYPENLALMPTENIKKEITTVDSVQQTSPREYLNSTVGLLQEEIKQVILSSTVSQQTTPREEIIIPLPVQEVAGRDIITVDNTQQTSPRYHSENVESLPKDQTTKIISTDYSQQTSPILLEDLKEPLEMRDVATVDSTQQTSPRYYSEDSISTSTEEPYEVHLRAQISIPQATTDFLDCERQGQERPQSIIGEKQKHKKRKIKKKTESPTIQSPESLSDPITTELAFSITPTSEDLSSKEISSIDEGISQLVSPVLQKRTETSVISQPKLSYSDVVQRSVSKSPSPSKTIVLPRKTEMTRLLDALEKRTQSAIEPPKDVGDNCMTVALLEPSVEKSYDLVVNKELQEVQDAVKNNNIMRTEKSVMIVIETISIWLEEIQYKIQRETVSGIKQSEETDRLNALQGYVQNLKEIIDITEINEEIIILIETLIRQVGAVKTLNNESSLKIKEVEGDWNKFLEDVENLSQSIERVKYNLDDIIMSEIPTQQKLDRLDKIELDNVDNIDAVTKMFRKYRSIAEINPKQEYPTKLYFCKDDTKQIENVINTERDRLLQLTSLAEEYEQTLQDFGQITDVAEALLDGKIIVSNLDHLHEEIQKHRKFFVNLSHCRAILESLEDNLDSETRSKFSALHNSLHDRATTIIDRAAGRAQQMTLAASRWTMLEQGMKEEQQWLRVAQQRLPDLTNVTSIDHEQYINLYQSVSLDVSHHHAKMLRLLSITEGLQNLIVCTGLETECSIALQTLLKLQDDIDSSLTRLTAFKENWVTYDHLIDRIEGWMKIANRELQHITPDNITTTGNLRRFWELKAQHEVHNNLKDESGTQFEKALEILPVSDEMVQRQFFAKIEDKWRDLANRIENLHATAIQNISDRDVSSTEKLNILEEEIRELRATLESLKGVIKSEDELNLYIERLQVMTGRIDRIQNELGRLSLLPTAESERLGALLSQSGILDDQIAEELERSLLLKEKIVQVQVGIVRCQKCQRRTRLSLEECEAAERLGSDVVEKASETCSKLLEDLASQWRDILALRQALHTLPISLRVCVSPTGLERDISALQETHAELEAACNDLSVRLRGKVQLWRRFERQLEMVQGAVREADYMVELLTVQGQVDYDRLLKATEKLETLSESLSRRSGELVGELRDAAAPLEASTEPSVAAQLKRELDDAAAAYEHTCSNLTQLCDKYHKAVELWKRYRDAAAAVRAFAEFHEGHLHALKPDDAPATAQACLEQESRVAELRSLAARVAEETGSRALQADADALARRLQLVAGAVQALADLGEARQLARAKAQHAKEKLCDMRQDLTPLHEDGEIVEDKLIALRDNLIALGKSEADIAPAKAELPDIDRDVSDEHSIVRILELWQAMFRDTFLHYHRLSTALVRSGDAATALRLWNEYLLDLQSFLSGSVPADYENLTEHRRLCRIHRNLLASQRSVLMNENKEIRNRDLSDKFDTLTNLHNETLARIVERHDEVCTRIAAWDDYREIYTDLLRWLKEIEREKEKLQLRYVHMKRIRNILAKIQNLSDKVPEGRKQSEKLLVNLKKVLEFTEEAYGASVRMEYAGIGKRVENLQASLDTWRDFLTRILALIGKYEKITNELHKLYSATQDEIMSYSDEERLSRPQIKKAIEKYTELRKKIEKTETQIEALTVIQEQLKECLSPQDIRIVNQRVWQLRQQRSDLEHQLSIIIHRLQERLEVYTIFDSRLSRFADWMTNLESRLETSSQSSEVSALDPHDLIRRINSDVQAETSLKEREFEWLSKTGTSLVDLSKKDEKSYSKNTSKQLKDVQERWYRLQETGRTRIAKINELLETISQLEERLTEIRLKLHSIESKLSAPVILEHLSSKAVDDKFRDRDDIRKDIENESGEVGETLNLCELVFNDSDVLKGNFDLRNLRTGVDIVEKKWKNICDMSEQRKKALKEIRKSAELTHSLLPKVEKKLDSIERRVENVETRKQRGESEDETVSKAVIKDLDALEDDVKRLEDAYSRVASTKGIELRSEGADEAARLRAAIRRWQQLRVRVDAAGADVHRQFVAAHGRAVVALAEADVRLTRALHLAPIPLDKAETFKELDGVEEELGECHALVKNADRLAAAVSTVSGVSDMVAEYRALYADVRARLDLARAEVVGDVDSAIQVDTLKWETDAALQVDTLTSKETYRSELATAVRETSDSLEALRTALVHQPKDNANGEELATAAKEIAKAGAKPAQTLELAKHLSELLLTECDATEEEAMLKEVESLSLRYEDLLAQAKKRELQINNLRLPHSASYALTCEHESGRLTCPLCSERNWKQLDNDLWRLEQWLQFAEATEEARTDPPELYDALEDAIQDHREFLLDLDSHKSIVVSLNVVGSHVAQHASSARDADRVRGRLAAANARWDAACERAGRWQKRLQRALVHNQQFHDIVVELVARFATAERGVRSREPLRLSRPAEELRRDFQRFSELRDELARAEPRVLALHESAQLLKDGDGDDICRRLGELRLRLQSLRKLSAVYALKLGAALARRPAPPHSALAAIAAAAAPSQLLEEEDDQISTLNLPPLDENDAPSESEESEEQQLGRLQRGLRFVCRVARASLPFQALLLLLLGAAALAPHASNDCRTAPALALDPVLRYPDGPPPL